ncbi:MAG: hypothetical protein AB1505_27680 [Candidatus Latescibacterota bacterium]
MAKQRASIHGATVLGTRRGLAQLIDEHQVRELLITPAAFAREDLRELAATCSPRSPSPTSARARLDTLLERLRQAAEECRRADIVRLLGAPGRALRRGVLTAGRHGSARLPVTRGGGQGAWGLSGALVGVTVRSGPR